MYIIYVINHLLKRRFEKANPLLNYYFSTTPNSWILDSIDERCVYTYIDNNIFIYRISALRTDLYTYIYIIYNILYVYACACARTYARVCVCVRVRLCLVEQILIIGLATDCICA